MSSLFEEINDIVDKQEKEELVSLLKEISSKLDKIMEILKDGKATR